MRPLLTAALCLAAATPATAGNDLYTTTFGKAANPCFERLYDAAHMKAHPRQTVTGISLQFGNSTEGGAPNKPAAFGLSFAFRQKPADGWFSGPATCETLSDHFRCYLESDGGEFSLTPQADGLTFTVVNQGGDDGKDDQIRLEGATIMASFGKPSGDDLVFVLPKTNKLVCDVDSGAH